MRTGKRLEIINIESCLPALVEFLVSQEDILAAYLFGSYGTGYQTALSDVDLAVLFFNDQRPDIRRILHLEAALNDLCKEDDINITVMNDADILLQFRILESGTLLYQRDRALAEDFHEYVFKIHGDFYPFYQKHTQEYDSALKEEYSCDRQR